MPCYDERTNEDFFNEKLNYLTNLLCVTITDCINNDYKNIPSESLHWFYDHNANDIKQITDKIILKKQEIEGLKNQIRVNEMDNRYYSDSSKILKLEEETLILMEQSLDKFFKIINKLKEIK